MRDTALMPSSEQPTAVSTNATAEAELPLTITAEQDCALTARKNSALEEHDSAAAVEAEAEPPAAASASAQAPASCATESQAELFQAMASANVSCVVTSAMSEGLQTHEPAVCLQTDASKGTSEPPVMHQASS